MGYDYDPFRWIWGDVKVYLATPLWVLDACGNPVTRALMDNVAYNVAIMLSRTTVQHARRDTDAPP